MNLEELVKKAKHGTLSDQELDYVAQKIKENTTCNDDNLYKLIYILGRAEAKQYRKLIEDFLHYPTDPMISRLALQILCNFWDYTLDYLNEIKKFIDKVEWDQENDIRLMAISCAGEYCRSSMNKELLQLLIRICDDPSEDSISQEGAFEALARAIGMEWNDIIAIDNLIETGEGDQIVLSVIEKARKILK